MVYFAMLHIVFVNISHLVCESGPIGTVSEVCDSGPIGTVSEVCDSGSIGTVSENSRALSLSSEQSLRALGLPL